MKSNLMKGLLLASIVISFGINGFPGVGSSNTNLNVTNTKDAQLVVYTYSSLLDDPPYDIEGNFSLFSGIPEDEIQIRRFVGSSEIITRLEMEKNQPEADVVIGIDNNRIHFIDDLSEILELYTPPNISQIDPNLIQNLDPTRYLIPYDYQIISFYYNNYIINSSTHPELENLTFESLLDSDLLSMLVVENPKSSSTGLGFLLWTIAVFGDPEINFDGLLGKDWRDWWKAAKNEILITKDWSAAFEIFYDTGQGKPIMVSYGSSPAYGYCQWQDDSTSAVVTYENNTANAWLQIEGLGLVKNAPNQENAKKFIDWFLSAEFQSELPEYQWMYPANTKANLSECVKQSAIQPDEVNRLNDLIPPKLLKKHLKEWQDEWEQAVVTVSGFDYPYLIFGLLIVVLPVLLKKRRKNK